MYIYIYIDRERAGDGGNEYSSEKSYVSYACSHKPVYEYIYIYMYIQWYSSYDNYVSHPWEHKPIYEYKYMCIYTRLCTYIDISTCVHEIHGLT